MRSQLFCARGEHVLGQASMKTKVLRVAACAALVSAAFSVLPASASTINWTLSGVAFDDSGTASGWFTTDSTSGDVVTYDVTTTPGTTLGGAVYDSSVANNYSSNGVYSSHSFILTNFNTNTYVNFEWVSALTNPGTVQLIAWDGNNGSYECNECGTVRGIISGEAISGAETPLPAALPLFAGGAVVIGLFARRKKRAEAAA